MSKRARSTVVEGPPSKRFCRSPQPSVTTSVFDPCKDESRDLLPGVTNDVFTTHIMSRLDDRTLVCLGGVNRRWLALFPPQVTSLTINASTKPENLLRFANLEHLDVGKNRTLCWKDLQRYPSLKSLVTRHHLMNYSALLTLNIEKLDLGGPFRGLTRLNQRFPQMPRLTDLVISWDRLDEFIFLERGTLPFEQVTTLWISDFPNEPSSGIATYVTLRIVFGAMPNLVKIMVRQQDASVFRDTAPVFTENMIEKGEPVGNHIPLIKV